MKRLMGLFLLVCMVLAAMPAMAEEVFCGNMEVVNCNEYAVCCTDGRTRLSGA